MFGWFRKRSRHEAPATESTNAPATPANVASEVPAAAVPQHPSSLVDPSTAPAIDPAVEAPSGDAALDASIPGADREPDASPAEAPAVAAPTTSTPADSGRIDTIAADAPPAAPSLRPAMPLSDNPNFAGLGLAQPDSAPPRLLEPDAALTDEARDELTALLLDMFGPRGRYRLEWRPDRELGDDAMFSEIMVADLVRRIQNSIAVSSGLEVRAAPLRLAIEAMHPDRTSGDDDDRSDAGDDDAATPEQRDDETTTDASASSSADASDVSAQQTEPAATPMRAASTVESTDVDTEQRVSAASVVDHRSSAISAFFAPRDGDDDLSSVAAPERRRSGRPLHDIDDDRAIA